MTSLNKLIEMDHEVGKSASPPKLLKVSDYYWWKDRFENFAKFHDIRIWICIKGGYIPPTHEFGDTVRVTSFNAMSDEDKKMYEAENKALSAITMCLPQEILHTFRKYRSSKELWEALESRYEGNVEVRQSRIDLLKKQFVVFKHMKNETLEEIITRFYHLMTELQNNNVEFLVQEIKDRLLDSLPPKWEIYTLLIKGNAEYKEMDLEEVIGKLRAYEMNLQKKETGYDQIQDPSSYFGKKSAGTSSSSGVTAFYTGEQSEVCEEIPQSNPDVCYLSHSAETSNVKSSVTGQSSKNLKSMPMSIKSADEQVNLLAAFMTSYEGYIQGKIVDPAIADEDYDQLDPDDLEEMDLKWQLAMISRRAKTFMSRTGRKLMTGRPAFDKSKVKCYNCNGFGHFARECQRPKMNPSNGNQSRQTNFTQGPTPQNANSRALVVTHQDGSYDWSNQSDNQLNETQALMANISEDTQSESTESKSNMDTDSIHSTEQIEVPTFSEWAILEETDSMNTEQFIAYMANLNQDSQKVLLNVNSVIDACSKFIELRDSFDQVVNSSGLVSSELEKVKEENVVLKLRNNELNIKIKANSKDTVALKDKINEQLQIIDLAHQTVEDKTRKFAATQKELADTQVRVAELNRKFEQFRSSSFNLNHLINSQRSSKDLTGLGYSEVPPPFNENYVSVQNEEASSSGVTIPDDSIKAKTVESGLADLKLDEQVKVSEEVPQSGLKRKVQFVSAGTLESTQVINIPLPTPPALLPETTVRPKAKRSSTKSRAKRSCFNCHEKGHVASCCPTRKQPSEFRPVNSDKSPAKTMVKAGSSNGSPPRKPILKTEKTTDTGINKSGLGFNSKPQSRFVSPKVVRPKSTSPNKRRITSQNSPSVFSRLNTTPQRFNTPNKSVNRFPNVSNRENYRESRVSHQGRNYREIPSSSNSNRAQNVKHSEKDANMGNGYLKEFTFTDEKGQSKTVTAWVPRDN